MEIDKFDRKDKVNMLGNRKTKKGKVEENYYSKEIV